MVNVSLVESMHNTNNPFLRLNRALRGASSTMRAFNSAAGAWPCTHSPAHATHSSLKGLSRDSGIENTLLKI